MPEYYWTDVITIKLNNCRSGYYSERDYESFNPEMLKEIFNNLKPFLEPTFSYVDIYHYVRFFLQPNQKNIGLIQHHKKILFDYDIPSEDKLRYRIKQEYPYYRLSQDWEQQTEGTVPHVCAIDNKSKIIYATESKPEELVVVRPRSWKLVYPITEKYKDDFFAYIKDMLEPTKLKRIKSQERDKYLSYHR